MHPPKSPHCVRTVRLPDKRPVALPLQGISPLVSLLSQHFFRHAEILRKVSKRRKWPCNGRSISPDGISRPFPPRGRVGTTISEGLLCVAYAREGDRHQPRSLSDITDRT